MNRLRQSFSWWCFENRGVPAARLLKEAKTIGYHGVDLLPEGLWNQAREAGLMIVNGSGPRPFGKSFNPPRASCLAARLYGKTRY